MQHLLVDATHGAPAHARTTPPDALLSALRDEDASIERGEEESWHARRPPERGEIPRPGRHRSARTWE